jgi:phosphonate dehydrogenase
MDGDSHMTAPRILVTHWVQDDVLELLRQHGEVIANTSRETWPRERVLSLAAHSDAMMAFMPDRVDEAFLSRCERLRVVAVAAKGLDNFDGEACARRGVWLTNVPDLLTVPTAELAIGLLIAVTRNFRAGDEHVRSGAFRGWRPQLYGTGLAGRTLGLIGCGAVGRAIAERAVAFGMRVVYCDPQPCPRYERLALRPLLGRSDFVMPLVHLTGETRHLIDVRAIAAMKRGAYLVNIGRGSVVDEAAVAQALQTGQLAGYAADVFEMEDVALENRPESVHPALLAAHERTFFTPHLGSAVDEARRAIALEAAENILQVLAGRRPRGAVNEPASAAVHE